MEPKEPKKKMVIILSILLLMSLVFSVFVVHSLLEFAKEKESDSGARISFDIIPKQEALPGATLRGMVPLNRI
jgi:hypothetical protein